MRRRTIAAFLTTLALTAVAAALAVSVSPLAATVAACGLVAVGTAFVLSVADGRASARICAERTAELEAGHDASQATWARDVSQLEAEIARRQEEAADATVARGSLSEAVALIREVAPIIDGLAKKAIEKSERGSTSLTEDIYEIGTQSTSLSRSISGFLSEMTSGEGSLQSSIEELNLDAARLGTIAGLYDQANASLDHSITNVSASIETTGDLLGQVSDIAEQTSILAINAAIYAAKAGELGKGFGVIAQETQKLASRAKELAGTIGSNTATIERQMADFSLTHRTLMADSQASLAQTIESIERTIGGLRPKVARIGSSIRTAAGTSTAVTGRLSEINMAMQEQDAIQQIVSHIAEILREALGRAPTAARGIDGERSAAREIARQIARRHFTMKDEFVAVGHDGYDTIDPTTTTLDDGTELSGNVTLF